jgi:DNA-binding transcriptional LysR family regulator
MDDHKLKVFCTVAETKSFSKASEIIRLTQPAVSLQIQALEEIYGTKLFNRSGCIITLTKAGDMLYKYAKEINDLYTSAEKEIGSVTGQVKGVVSVGASTTIGNYILPSVIAEFKRKYLKVGVHIHISNTRSVIDSLNAASIDVGLVEGDAKKQKLTVEKLIPDEMVVIMSPLHPWAKKNQVSVLDIPKEPFILREEGSGTRQMIEKHLAKSGISSNNIKAAFIMGSTESIKSAVEEGLGISILSRWAVKKEIRNGRKPGSYSHALDKFLGFLKNFSFDKLLND